QLTHVAIRSAGALTLHDPSDVEAPREIVSHAGAVADLEALRELARATEIDFDELNANVNEAVEWARNHRGADSRVSVGEVLASFPATQGVASIVGLLALASRYGMVDDDADPEILTWQGADGRSRQAHVTRHVFSRRIS
ncbi:MAG: DUF3375 family protein, partial [Demequina sp.]